MFSKLETRCALRLNCISFTRSGNGKNQYNAHMVVNAGLTKSLIASMSEGRLCQCDRHKEDLSEGFQMKAR